MDVLTAERSAEFISQCAKAPGLPLPDWLTRDNKVFLAVCNDFCCCLLLLLSAAVTGAAAASL